MRVWTYFWRSTNIFVAAVFLGRLRWNLAWMSCSDYTKSLQGKNHSASFSKDKVQNKKNVYWKVKKKNKKTETLTIECMSWIWAKNWLMIDFQFQGHTTRICKVQKEPSAERYTGVFIPIASIIQIVTRMWHKISQKNCFFSPFFEKPTHSTGSKSARDSARGWYRCDWVGFSIAVTIRRQ